MNNPLNPSLLVFVLAGTLSCADEQLTVPKENVQESAAVKEVPRPAGRWTAPRRASDLPSQQAAAIVIASPSAEEVISAPLGGRVVELFVSPGSALKTGDKLAVLQLPALAEAAAAYGAANETAYLHSQQVETLVALEKKGFVKQSELAEAKTRAAEAKGARAKARATLAVAGVSTKQASRFANNGGRLTLFAQREGVVVAQHKRVGEACPQGEAVLVIATLGEVPLEAKVALEMKLEKSMSFYSAGGKSFPLSLISQSPSVDEKDQSRRAWFSFVPSKDTPLPRKGQRGLLKAESGERGIWVVPRAALRNAQEKAYVDVRKGGKIQKVTVSSWEERGNTLFIRADLSLRDEIFLPEEVTP